VHRTSKGEGDGAPTAAISILDSVSTDYVTATTVSWNNNSEGLRETAIEVTPALKPEKEKWHATLW
jgi:hypothetical protein